MTILRRVAAPLSALLAIGLTPSAAAAANADAAAADATATNATAATAAAAANATADTVAMAADAVATVYDENSRVLAEARFVAFGDSFTLVKRAEAGGRPYVEYKYVRLDGSLQTGTHHGLTEAGAVARFDHEFGEGRAVEFRVCVEDGYGSARCSGTEQGENWTKGHA